MQIFKRSIHGILLLVSSFGPFAGTMREAAADTLNVPLEFLLNEALIMANTGDTILIQPGVQVTDDTLEILNDDITIAGASGNPQDVVIQPNADGLSLFEATERIGIEIRDLTLRRASDTISPAFAFLECQLKIENCIIRDCTGTRGAASVIIESSAVIRNCTFENNVGSTLPPVFFDVPGGALAVLGQDRDVLKVALIECVFQNNVCIRRNGGALSVYKATFPLDKSLPAKGASASQADLTVLSATRCHFAGNMSESGFGGSIYIEEPVDGGGPIVALADCRIESSTAVGGGGMAIERQFGFVDVDISDSRFAGNNAFDGGGGGILVYEDPAAAKGFNDREIGIHFRVRDSTFTNNVSQIRGGGIGIIANEFRTGYILQRNRFQQNLAPEGGGLFVAISSPIEMTKNGTLEKGLVFGGNFILEGRILENTFFLNGFDTPLLLKESGEKGSTSLNAQKGGGMYIGDSSSEVKRNRFVANLATRGGGAFLHRDGSQVVNNRFGDPEFVLPETTKGGGGPNPGPGFSELKGNIANHAGGGLYIEGSQALNKGAGPPDRYPLIANNLFHFNISAVQGGGVQISSATPGFMGTVFAGNALIDNYAFDGSAIALNEDDPDWSFVMNGGVSIVHNTMIGHGSLCDLLPPSPFKGNDLECGPGADPTSDSMVYLGPNAEPLIANNAIVGGTELNDATAIHEIESLSPPVLANAFFNVAQLYFDNGTAPASLFGLNNQPQNGDNIVADPLFEEPGPDSFGILNPHLAPGSPLINMATEVLIGDQFEELLPFDIDTLYRGPEDGDPRILDAIPEIGADERENVPTATPTLTPTLTLTLTQTPTPSSTPSESETPTPTFTSTNIIGATETATLTPTQESSDTPTATGIVTGTPTPTGSITETPTPTGSITETPTATHSVAATETPDPNSPLDPPGLLFLLNQFKSNGTDVEFLFERSLTWKAPN